MDFYFDEDGDYIPGFDDGEAYDPNMEYEEDMEDGWLDDFAGEEDFA